MTKTRIASRKAASIIFAGTDEAEHIAVNREQLVLRLSFDLGGIGQKMFSRAFRSKTSSTHFSMSVF